MLEALLPQRIDNVYDGSEIALWLLGLLVLMKLGIGLNSIFNGRSVARDADGIPIETFTPEGARTVVALFGLFGLAQVIFGLLCLLVLVRYRALVPFMFALLLAEHLGRRLILRILPVPRTGRPPAVVVNLVFLVVMVVGLALSLWN